MKTAFKNRDKRYPSVPSIHVFPMFFFFPIYLASKAQSVGKKFILD